MNRLLNPNRENGYPLTGEALSILGVDTPAYINAILDQLTPSDSIVFLSDDYAYVKRGNYKEIMLYTLTDITQEQLMAGTKSLVAFTETEYSDTVGSTVYTNTRCSRVIAISPSATAQLNPPNYYSLETLLQYKLLKEIDYINTVTASSETIGNIGISGHAIIKEGYANINLLIEFTGTGTVYVDFPDEFNCNYGMIVLLYMNEDDTDYNYIIGALRGTRLQFSSTNGTIPRHLGVHLYYKPDIPTPLNL